MSTLIPVMTKERKRMGVTYPATETEYAVEFVRTGKKITGIKIYRHGELKNTFKVGDEAEYDSYNLRYTGTIEAITEKGVTIWTGKVRRNGGLYMGPSTVTEGCKKHIVRLDLNAFCWRNYDFDAVKVAAENHETMMHI